MCLCHGVRHGHALYVCVCVRVLGVCVCVCVYDIFNRSLLSRAVGRLQGNGAIVALTALQPAVVNLTTSRNGCLWGGSYVDNSYAGGCAGGYSIAAILQPATCSVIFIYTPANAAQLPFANATVSVSPGASKGRLGQACTLPRLSPTPPHLFPPRLLGRWPALLRPWEALICSSL